MGTHVTIYGWKRGIIPTTINIHTIFDKIEFLFHIKKSAPSYHEAVRWSTYSETSYDVYER